MIELLAHRGYWLAPAQKNTLEAFERAFAAGHGVELDVRDQNGLLVVSHDCPVGACLSFETTLAAYGRAGAPGRLAINIKADGLAGRLTEMLVRRSLVERCFVFDMSVPDMLVYLAGPIPVYTRFSEFEQDPACYDRCAGVWLDAFMEPWASTKRLVDDIGHGKAVALVSPELHGKPHGEAWREWSQALASIQGGGPGQAMLCTDFPDQAQRAFALGAPA
jgi:hypothetical protein